MLDAIATLSSSHLIRLGGRGSPEPVVSSASISRFSRQSNTAPAIVVTIATAPSTRSRREPCLTTSHPIRAEEDRVGRDEGPRVELDGVDEVLAFAQLSRRRHTVLGRRIGTRDFSEQLRLSNQLEGEHRRLHAFRQPMARLQRAGAGRPHSGGEGGDTDPPADLRELTERCSRRVGCHCPIPEIAARLYAR